MRTLPLKTSLAFLTGSQVYGTPTDRSDIDLCILISRKDLDILCKFFTPEKNIEEYDDGAGVPLRIGRLNLLCITDPEIYKTWIKGTEEMIAKKPVTRDEAVLRFTALREEYWETIS